MSKTGSYGAKAGVLKAPLKKQPAGRKASKDSNIGRASLSDAGTGRKPVMSIRSIR